MRTRPSRRERGSGRIEGVRLRALHSHADHRGSFTELFRDEWSTGVAPVQWSVMVSQPGVLRGMHVHPRHVDYCTLVAGRCTVALRDLRKGSPSEGCVQVFEVTGESMLGITIPNGVLHGFYYPEPSVQLLAVSHTHDPADELGCRWDDPATGIEWPTTAPLLSPRDASLGGLHELLERLPPHAP